jgi:hypothetical protein
MDLFLFLTLLYNCFNINQVHIRKIIGLLEFTVEKPKMVLYLVEEPLSNLSHLHFTNTSRANQLLEENNILLRAIADKIRLDVEEALCPITKKYSPSYNDEDLKPEEEGEDEELLNWE